MIDQAKYDVFISHAFEDKNSFTDELATQLHDSGLKVWYSGFQLKLGDSIAGSINEAMKSAAFGIVVVSPTYLQKQWAMNELHALFAQENQQTRILPILHNITIAEIREHFPILADRYTISSKAGFDVIVKKVHQAMSSANKSSPGPSTVSSGAGRSSDKNKSAEKTTTVSGAKHNAHSTTVNTGSRKTLILIISLIIGILFAIYQLSENTHGTIPTINNDNPVQPN